MPSWDRFDGMVRGGAAVVMMWQCDLGSNYKGLFLLVTAAEVPGD